MKRFIVFTLSVCVVLALTFSTRPTFAASATANFLYYQPGSGTRQPPSGTGPKLSLISGSVLDPNLSGSSYAAPTSVQNSFMIGTTTYTLAFISITGGAGGGITVFPNGSAFSPPVNVPLQNPPQDILIDYVYFPSTACQPNTTCTCPPNTICSGADINEYSETEGTLLDDTFVEVFSPTAIPNSALTSTANTEGFVDTTASVRIHALNPPVPYQNQPTGGIFDQWSTGPDGTIGASLQDLDVKQHLSDIALALYREPCPNGYTWSPTPTVHQCLANPTKAPRPLPPRCPPGGVVVTPPGGGAPICQCVIHGRNGAIEGVCS